MYAIRELDTHAWVQFASAGGVSLNTHRDRAKRFPPSRRRAWSTARCPATAGS
jgi:hypothetical protein